MWIDIVLLCFIIVGIIQGWRHGFIISVFVAAAWILGVIGALKFCSVVSVELRERFDWDGVYVPVVSFILIFLLIAFAIYLIGKSLEKVVELAQLGFINKFFGIILRVSVLVFVFSLFIWLLNQAALISPEVKSESRTFDFLNVVATQSIAFISEHLPVIKNVFHDIEEFFEVLSGKSSTVV